MDRDSIFVSYSHQDRIWLDRLRQHLGAIERRGRVHLWADDRIAMGSDWGPEIDQALSSSKAAILLVSPPFLASTFIWNVEMRRILQHREQGMQVYPLLVRPCAWKVDEDLRRIQARPRDGRALALRQDAEIDRELALFVYELAELIHMVPVDMVVDEWEQHRLGSG